ncbi:MAG: hypothetical protein KGJ78_12890 [Alphaproteobacteria bacterium]|nr:hypothetical protein [Alphaproteobacteria bacterium]
MKRNILALVSMTLAVAAAANGQSSATYPVRTLDFDIWCTEEQHLPADRCDKRLPEDMQKFESYRAIIERYEVPYLQDKQHEANFDRNIMHNDPIDHPPGDPNQPPPQPTDGR